MVNHTVVALEEYVEVLKADLAALEVLCRDLEVRLKDASIATMTAQGTAPVRLQADIDRIALLEGLLLDAHKYLSYNNKPDGIWVRIHEALSSNAQGQGAALGPSAAPQSWAPEDK